MGGIIDKITEFIKELLQGWVLTNFETMFTDVNDKVGTIAGEVSKTPSTWNSGIFDMIKALSDNVMIPIAGMIISFVLNLTKRQIICFSGAAVAGIPLYFLTKGLIGTSAASLLMMGAMLPFFFFAMYEKNGFPAEKILYFMLRQKILTPGIRPYRSENLYKQLEEKEKLRREVRYLEEKAKGRTGKSQKKQL